VTVPGPEDSADLLPEQILVLQDVLGITSGKPPRFARNFMPGVDSIQQAISNYVQAVKKGEFPAPEHSFT